MTTSNETRQSEDWGGRLSPGDVHDVLFTRAGLGRRGYDEVEVDVFLERVQQEITTLIAEKADLRDEVSRLKSQLAQKGGAPAAGGLSKEEANLQAVRLLAAAQQTADLYVADAEKYSQRVTADAREHSEEILGEARQAAQQLVEQAQRHAREAAERTVEGSTAGVAAPSKEELDQQITYLKTFSQVCRVQLRAYLEALLRDVEEEWGKADPGVVVSVPAPGRPAEVRAGEVTALPAGAPGPTAAEAPASAPGRPAAPGTSRIGKAAKADGPASPTHIPGTSEPSTPPVQVDLTEADASPNGDKPPRRRNGAVTHSR